MATTVEQLIRAAYATSRKNQPGVTASDTGELLPLVQRTLRGLFAEGARINREFFGARRVVAFDATVGGWKRPVGTDSISLILSGTGATRGDGAALALGTRVADVPFDQRWTEPGLPSGYWYGQVFYPSGNAPDPVGGNLEIYCSTRPRDLSGLIGDPGGTIDPLWPEEYNTLLILKVAAYLARKDGDRDAEVASFEAEYATEFARFQQFLTFETITEVRSSGHFNRVNTPGLTAG